MPQLPPRPGPNDIVLGEPIEQTSRSIFRRHHHVVRLTSEQQAYHGAIFGRSGIGKSSLLHSIFVQHLLKGHGVALIDPHSDLSLGLLSHLTQIGYFAKDTAFENLIYLDFTTTHIVPFNILAPYTQPHTAALHTLEAMMRVWPELRRAPSFQQLTLAALYALHQSDLPITFLHQFLTDEVFRVACLDRVSDPLIRQTFGHPGALTGQETGAARRRAFLLSFNELSRLSLGEPDSVLNIRSLMDRGTSLIVSLGHIEDTETRNLIGALLLVQIEQAALSRAGLPEAQRVPWTLIVDEWPTFSRSDRAIANVLEQCRKFGLRILLSAQSPSQVASDGLVAALENCRLQIAFGLSRKSAVEQARELAELDPATADSPQFELLAQAIQHLGPQECFVRIDTAPPVQVKTLSLPAQRPDPTLLSSVLGTYARLYHRTYQDAKHRAAKLATPCTAPATPPQPFTLFGQSDDGAS